MAGLVCFFSAKAFLMLAIVTAKIIYLGFLASCINGVAPIIWISRVSGELWSSIISCVSFFLGLGSVLGIYLALNSDLGSLSIFFMVKYQFFLYSCVVNLSFCLAWGNI